MRRVLHFNSIKVRLEPFAHRCRDEYRRFQFHKGAIRTPEGSLREVHRRYFNSIKVRLERRSGVRGEARRNHFNSIKVRLEPFNVYKPKEITIISIP